MLPPLISIILLNYKGWKDTIECLESIFNIQTLNYQVIVVDNNSPDDSMARIIDWAEGRLKAQVNNEALTHLSHPHINKPIAYSLYKSAEIFSNENNYAHDEKLVLIDSERNDGFAAGNNIGMSYVLAQNSSQFVWLLNNDTVIEPNSLDNLLFCSMSYKKSHKKIGIIGAKLLHYYHPSLIQAVGGLYNPNTANSKHLGDRQVDNGQFDHDISSKIDYPVGASLFVSIDYIRDVGLMCEDYFLYFEELDWILRGKAQGWDIGYCWKAKIYHKEGATIGSNSKGAKKSLLSDFYGLRNKILFTSKHFPNKSKAVKLSYVAVIVNRLLRKQYRTIPFILKMIFAKQEELKKMKYIHPK